VLRRYILAQLLSLAGIILELGILWRALRAKLLPRFPLFYAYIFWVLLLDISSYGVYGLGPSVYRNWYWGTQILTLLVGYGVILEIVHKSFKNFAGAERAAVFMVIAVFALVFAYVIFRSFTIPHWTPAATYYELERDLRTVQAVVLAGVLAVVFGYRISIGRNLKGVILGYGLYLASSVISSELRSYAGSSFHAAWRLIQPYTFLISLCVWLIAMWAYQEIPEERPVPRLDSDYEAFAMKTRNVLETMRSYLQRTVRP